MFMVIHVGQTVQCGWRAYVAKTPAHNNICCTYLYYSCGHRDMTSCGLYAPPHVAAEECYPQLAAELVACGDQDCVGKIIGGRSDWGLDS
jgi:hypothetical protein